MDVLKFNYLLTSINNAFGVSVEELLTPADKQKAYELRYRVYSQAGYLDSSSISQNKMCDIWDKYSILLGAKDKEGKLLGTIRINTMDPYSFPSDNLFVAQYPFSITEAVEVGKFAVEKKSSTRNRLVSFALTLKAAVITKKLNYNFWVFSTTPSLKKSFENLGSEIHLLSDQLMPIAIIKQFCSNWKMFENLNEKYYFLKINQLNPKHM